MIITFNKVTNRAEKVKVLKDGKRRINFLKRRENLSKIFQKAENFQNTEDSQA